MKKAEVGIVVGIIFLIAISSVLMGCGPASSVVKVVELNRDRYECKIDPSQFKQYHGKNFLLASIEDESDNTENLYYYNPQKTIGYRLYYSSSSVRQPVVSYYWYALQKGFECAGLKVEEYIHDDQEVALTFNSLTDEEILFDLALMKNGRQSYATSYTIKMPAVDANNADVLEQRAYGMLDMIVTTILKDPHFETAFLKRYIPPVHGNQSYESISGFVLKNGYRVNGEILNKKDIREANADAVQIRNEQGQFLSYSLDEVIFFY